MTDRRSKRKADLKVVMVGDESVGKTCLVLRYIDRQFQESISTIGASFVLKPWGNYNIAIWDTAGGERYSGLTTFYYRNASAAILAFDIFDRATFENLNQRYIPILNNVSSTALKVIVATKRDLLKLRTRQISEKEGIELAKRVNPTLDFDNGFIPYFETSSKSGTKVDEMFEFIFDYFYPNKGLNPRPLAENKNISLEQDSNRSKPLFSCCQ